MTTIAQCRLGATIAPVLIVRMAPLMAGWIAAPVDLVLKVVRAPQVDHAVKSVAPITAPAKAHAGMDLVTEKIAVAETSLSGNTPEESHSPAGCAAPRSI